MNLLKPKKATLLNSTVLILIGIIGYYYNSSSITALIPVFLGSAIFLYYIFYEKNNKVFSHICVTLILLTFLGLFKSLVGAISKSDLYSILRFGIMQLISFYCIICFISSFIKARKKIIKLSRI